MSAATQHDSRLTSVLLVLAGGIVGVGAREGFMLAVPNADGIPIVVPVVNVLGAFVLGFLYEALTRDETPPQLTSRLKLLIGTGFCGGLTTYSSLATDTAVLLDDSRVGVAAVYALGTLVVGGLATLAGIALAASRHTQSPRGEGASR
ncbi:CrcB family protein [Nocardioides sp. zg-1228]|uniref:fluoride efflux transporter FluC n=1 Tax=Nocardioides sp. zg-1228 TaxID=2763008 RepID=UPI0016424122|nr:CrcB family protein [Nocardioides sp. zg-1228]MBC2933072.1 CrcB family protein [Nocardioides sp. zg-1228]QSF56738.1 CrcB family protein [Nocardioides sp. zg-1228]